MTLLEGLESRNSVTLFSIRRSHASGHLRPSGLKSLIPLNSAGLWDAEIMTPPITCFLGTRYANDGVEVTPVSQTPMPARAAPSANAWVIHRPDARVSRPK